EPAEGGDRRLDQRGDLRLARHITAAGNGPIGGFAEQIQRLLAAVLADVRADEARALAAEEQRRRAPHAGAGAGDDGDFVAEQHTLLLPRRPNPPAPFPWREG